MDQLTVVRFLQVTMKVKGTAYSSVSDDRFEDLGAVDLPPLPLALPQHVCGVGDLRGGERVAGEG